MGLGLISFMKFLIDPMPLVSKDIRLGTSQHPLFSMQIWGLTQVILGEVSTLQGTKFVNIVDFGLLMGLLFLLQRILRYLKVTQAW